METVKLAAFLIGMVAGLGMGITTIVVWYEWRYLPSLQKRIERLQTDYVRYKHGYETATHDECLCNVNNKMHVSPKCSVHFGWSVAQSFGIYPPR